MNQSESLKQREHWDYLKKNKNQSRKYKLYN